jgi:3'(2'), 5'-bisphosphate nucleotidase
MKVQMKLLVPEWLFNKSNFMNSYSIKLEVAVKAAIYAGKEILNVYDENVEIESKSDNSPLTLADKLSHNKICDFLRKTRLPILSEEGKLTDYKERKQWNEFWLIDPLDGTKEFIKKNGEFTVNVALINEGIPVLGVVYAPVINALYFAAKGIGSYKYIISFSEFVNAFSEMHFLDALIGKSVTLPEKIKRNNFTVVASRSHLTHETESFINELKAKHRNVDFISKGSSLKICLVAEGVADVYPRLAPTMEWDTAAGHAIALYSGKSVRLYKNNKVLKYNRENLLNDWFVVS